MEPQQSVRKVILPSGREVEVVFQGDLPPNLAMRQVVPEAPARPLHECGYCDSELVYPIHWDEAGPDHWKVHLRCPNCEWRAEGTFEQELVDHFDEQLDAGTELLVHDLKKLMEASMSEEIERFAVALQADGILPEDF